MINSRVIAGVLSTVVVCLAAPAAYAELVAYEGFDYSGTTHLGGQDGGYGFDGAWSNVSDAFNNVTNDDQSLDMPNYPFTPVGGRLLGNSSDAKSIADRPLASGFDLGQDGELFVSMLVQRPGADNVKGSLYGYTSTGTRLFRISLSGLSIPLIGLGDNYTRIDSVNLTAGDTFLMVAKIEAHDEGDDILRLKVYGANDTVDTEEPVQWDGDFSGDINDVFSVLRLELNDGFTTAMDEIRIGTDWASVAVPEPGTLSLLTVCGLLRLTRRR